MLTLLSLAAPEVVIMTTKYSASDEKFDIMTTLSFKFVNDIQSQQNIEQWKREPLRGKTYQQQHYGVATPCGDFNESPIKMVERKGVPAVLMG